MQHYLAEFFGTVALVFVILWTGDPLATGATLGSLVYLFGGAFNPAVSVGLYLNKKLSLKDTFVYVVLQVIAAFLAFFLYKLK